jgi:hypothetical protein
MKYEREFWRRLRTVIFCGVFVWGAHAQAVFADSVRSGNNEYVIPKVTEALETSLATDTSSAMAALVLQDHTLAPLVTYLQELIRRKNYDGIAKLIDNLDHGTKTKVDMCDFLGQSGKNEKGETHFINQLNLGYFMGALVVAIKKTTWQQSERAAIARNIINSFLSVGTIASTSEGTVLSCGLTSKMAQETAKEIEAEACRWASGLMKLSRARNLKTGKYMRLAGNIEFETAFASFFDTSSYIEILHDGCR